MRSSTLFLAFIGVILAHCVIADQQQQQQQNHQQQPFSPCYVDCANSAAKAIGCKDASDSHCWCGNQQFVLDQGQCTLEQCDKEITDRNLARFNFHNLESKCKADTGSCGLQLVDVANLTRSKVHPKKEKNVERRQVAIPPYPGNQCIGSCGGYGGGYGGGGYGGGYGGYRHWGWNASSKLLGPSLSTTITTTVSITAIGALFAFYF